MRANTIPLTVIILTHRSDRRFKKALASAQPANEILVIDYDSHNSWEKLKKQFNFKKIARQGPIKNFATERNHSLKQARNDWVLFLDSDEVIESKSWSAIKKVVETTNTEGVFVRRKDIFYGKTLRFGETGKTWILRLVRKKYAKFVRPVHEFARVKGTTHKSSIVLNHTAHLTIQDFLSDITQYAKIEAEYQQDHLLSPLQLAIKTIIYPKGKFLQNYFLKLGFLDGWRGLVYASMMSLHSLLVRVFSYEGR